MSAADRRATRAWLLGLILASALGTIMSMVGALAGEASALPPLALIGGIAGLIAMRPKTGKAHQP